jgi:hypothetical protein
VPSPVDAAAAAAGSVSSGPNTAGPRASTLAAAATVCLYASVTAQDR